MYETLPSPQLRIAFQQWRLGFGMRAIRSHRSKLNPAVIYTVVPVDLTYHGYDTEWIHEESNTLPGTVQ
jgi:hypothetical protein